MKIRGDNLTLLGLCNLAIQHLYITHKGKCGECYRCPKGMEEYYKKKLCKDIIKRQEDKVKKAQEKLNNLKLTLTNID